MFQACIQEALVSNAGDIHNPKGLRCFSHCSRMIAGGLKCNTIDLSLSLLSSLNFIIVHNFMLNSRFSCHSIIEV